MAPSTLATNASNINAFVGLEIEGIFILPGSTKIIKVQDIKSFDEFTKYFIEYTNQKENNLVTLKGFIEEEILFTEFHDDYSMHESPEFNDRVRTELINNRNKWWMKFFNSFEDAYQFSSRTYFTPKYGSNKDGSKIFTEESDEHDFDIKSISEDKKRHDMLTILTKSKFSTYIDKIVDDSSIINNNDNADTFIAEIVTHPIPYSKVTSFVQEFFQYLIDTFKFETNNSTGFHINVSIDGRTKIDFCKLFVFMGEEYELRKYSRVNNVYAKSHMTTVAPAKEQSIKDIQDFTKEVNYQIKTTGKYYSFNINHWRTLHYIEFRIAGGHYSEKVPQLIQSINRYVNVLDIATDPEKHKQNYYKKVAQLMNNNIAKSYMKLKHDTLQNARSNIYIKTGFMPDTVTDIHKALDMDGKSITLSSIERIWLKMQLSKTQKLKFI